MNLEAMIKVLLVDDEFLALNLLEGYVRQVPDLQLVGRYKSPMDGIKALQETEVDLLFLDIQMPGISGLNLLKTLPKAPLTVFTTAYSEHAVTAFDLNAVDYLLKPFTFERFLQSLNKVREQLQQHQPKVLAPEAATDKNYLIAKVDGKLMRIPHADILYIEGLKEYVRIVTQEGKYITLESLKNLEEELAASHFMRVHKSYIIAAKKVQSMDGNMLEMNGHKIPISRSRREVIIKAIFSK